MRMLGALLSLKVDHRTPWSTMILIANYISHQYLKVRHSRHHGFFKVIPTVPTVTPAPTHPSLFPSFLPLGRIVGGGTVKFAALPSPNVF